MNCSNFGENVATSPQNSQSMFRGRILEFPQGKDGTKCTLVLWLEKLRKAFGQCRTDFFFFSKKSGNHDSNN